MELPALQIGPLRSRPCIESCPLQFLACASAHLAMSLPAAAAGLPQFMLTKTARYVLVVLAVTVRPLSFPVHLQAA